MWGVTAALADEQGMEREDRGFGSRADGERKSAGRSVSIGGSEIVRACERPPNLISCTALRHQARAAPMYSTVGGAVKTLRAGRDGALRAVPHWPLVSTPVRCL